MERREVIIREGAALFARRGVAGTTVRDIGDAAGIRWGSLYHHFPSKDDIVEAVLRESLDDLLARFDEAAREADALDRFKAMVAAAFDVVATHTDACLVYLNDRAYLGEIARFAWLDKVAADVERRWLDTIDACVADGHIRSGVDPYVVLRFGIYSIWMSAGWLRHDGRSGEELAAAWLDLVLLGAMGGAR